MPDQQATFMLQPWNDFANVIQVTPYDGKRTVISGADAGYTIAITSERELSSTGFTSQPDPATLENGRLIARIDSSDPVSQIITFGADTRDCTNPDIESSWQWVGMVLGVDGQRATAAAGPGLYCEIRVRTAPGAGSKAWRTISIAYDWIHTPTGCGMQFTSFLWLKWPVQPNGPTPLDFSATVLNPKTTWFMHDLRAIGLELQNDANWLQIPVLDLGAMLKHAFSSYGASDKIPEAVRTSAFLWSDWHLNTVQASCEITGKAVIEVDVKQLNVVPGGSMPAVGRLLV